jgi:hypothetical protein
LRHRGLPALHSGLVRDCRRYGKRQLEHESCPLPHQACKGNIAADQAGQSRIWGGIHVTPDDFNGRKVGDFVGLAAFAKAESFFPP